MDIDEKWLICDPCSAKTLHVWNGSYYKCYIHEEYDWFNIPKVESMDRDGER